MEYSEINPLNICIVGPSKSGKSKILERYLYNKFENTYRFKSPFNYTQTAVFFEDKQVHLKIWNVTGEWFSKILGFFQYSRVIIFVFDKSTSQSLQELEIAIKMFEEVDDHVGFVIAGNKSDLDPIISFDEGYELAARFNAAYIEVSALTGQNIQLLFELTIKKMSALSNSN